MDILVPENCINAQFSLNDKELLGFFSKENIPEDPEFVQVTHCNDENKYTPLRPGQFQSINFRWESGDVLKCFFYYQTPSNCRVFLGVLYWTSKHKGVDYEY